MDAVGWRVAPCLNGHSIRSQQQQQQPPLFIYLTPPHADMYTFQRISIPLYSEHLYRRDADSGGWRKPLPNGSAGMFVILTVGH